MFLILAADPVDQDWSVVLQTENQNEALDFWNEAPAKDPSLRIMLNTEDYINFPIEKV